MKILIDINHPGHVHFFKNIIWELQKKGNQVLVTASNKDIALDLLKEYGIKYINIGSYGKSLLSKIINLFVLDIKMLFIVLKFNPNYILGIASARGAHIGWLLRKKVYIFDDTEHAKEQIALYLPFATKVFTPSVFLTNLVKKQVKYNGYHEIAYLHPNWFKPDPQVLDEVGIKQDEVFFIVRFISWRATHDIGHFGFSTEGKEKLISMLEKKGKVFITSEYELPQKFEKYRIKIPYHKIHDLLYYATMYVGEGGTMASEAAILGTPSIFVNTLTAGTFQDLEKNYQLMYCFTEECEAMKKIEELLKNKDIKNEWKQKSDKLFINKVDVTNFILNQIN